MVGFFKVIELIGSFGMLIKHGEAGKGVFGLFGD